MTIIRQRARTQRGSRLKNMGIRVSKEEGDALLQFCYDIKESFSAFAVPILLKAIGREDLLDEGDKRAIAEKEQGLELAQDVLDVLIGKDEVAMQSAGEKTKPIKAKVGRPKKGTKAAKPKRKYVRKINQE